MNGKGDQLAIFSPFQLKWGSGAHSGVEGQVKRLARRRPRLHVPAALALGASARAATRAAAHDLIQRRVKAARVKNLSGLYLLAALPPIRIAVVKYLLLRRRFDLSGLIGLFRITFD
jgi:hypothetical protein